MDTKRILIRPGNKSYLNDLRSHEVTGNNIDKDTPRKLKLPEGLREEVESWLEEGKLYFFEESFDPTETIREMLKNNENVHEEVRAHLEDIISQSRIYRKEIENCKQGLSSMVERELANLKETWATYEHLIDENLLGEPRSRFCDNQTANFYKTYFEHSYKDNLDEMGIRELGEKRRDEINRKNLFAEMVSNCNSQNKFRSGSGSIIDENQSPYIDPKVLNNAESLKYLANTSPPLTVIKPSPYYSNNNISNRDRDPPKEESLLNFESQKNSDFSVFSSSGEYSDDDNQSKQEDPEIRSLIFLKTNELSPKRVNHSNVFSDLDYTGSHLSETEALNSLILPPPANEFDQVGPDEYQLKGTKFIFFNEAGVYGNTAKKTF